MTLENINKELQKGFNDVIKTIEPLDTALFFKKPETKWSAADNLEHLILSVKPLKLAFQLPKFSLLIFGKPNRPIRTYDELVKKYQAKLNAGAQAPAAFVPRSKYLDKSLLIETFNSENQKLIKSLSKWNEDDLNRYLLPHPLLGKLYAREMLYFTIYHTRHHLKAIEKLI